MASGSEGRRAVPYGPLGLVLSLVAGIVLMAAYSALLAGMVALVDAALFGWQHMRGLIETLRGDTGATPVPIVLIRFIALYLALAATSLSLAWFRGRADWRALVAWRDERCWWRDRRYWSLVIAAIVYGILASLLLDRLYPPSNDWFVLSPGPSALLLTFVLVVIAAPVSEELLFRGWIYTSLRSHFGAPASVTISGVLFAFAHYEKTHLYALAVLPLGLILGIVRERTGTIRATASLHALYNFSALLLTMLGPG